MAIRRNEAMGFVDAASEVMGAARAAVLLERLDADTPWEALAAPIRMLPEYNAPRAGYPACDLSGIVTGYRFGTARRALRMDRVERGRSWVCEDWFVLPSVNYGWVRQNGLTRFSPHRHVN